MREVVLLVNNRKYSGWKDIRITRSLESLCGSFSMSVSERWNSQDDRWPIVEGDECVVLLGNDTIITGYVDARQMSLSANDHSFVVAGRDRAGDLIDCSAVLDAWEFNGISVLEIAQKVAKPFDITVKLADGVTEPAAPRRVVVNPGDSAYDVIDRACRLAGLFAISDAFGNVVLTRAGAEMAGTPLVQGSNILDASARHDASARYSLYKVTGQQQGEDLIFGSAAADVSGEATDDDVKRTARVLMVRAEGSVTIQQAKDRAAWEAAIRRARALEVSVTVQGWEQADGNLWPVNARVNVDAPLLSIPKEMLISEVTYALSEGSGTTTELTLRLPGAFDPQPELPESETPEAEDASE